MKTREINMPLDEWYKFYDNLSINSYAYFKDAYGFIPDNLELTDIDFGKRIVTIKLIKFIGIGEEK